MRSPCELLGVEHGSEQAIRVGGKERKVADAYLGGLCRSGYGLLCGQMRSDGPGIHNIRDVVL